MSASGHDAGMLSIGALSRATGIPAETLRTWELRYGFPVPMRRPSGHRRYPLSSVSRLRRVAEALARGHRAGEVVPASAGDLTRLLEALPAAALPAAPEANGVAAEAGAGKRGAHKNGSDLAVALRAIARFDTAALSRHILVRAERETPLALLTETVAPLLICIGERWAAGQLDVRHEHFASECLSDLLRSLRRPHEEQARGPVAILAALPRETHALGLQMLAYLLSSLGLRVAFLGTDLPVDEIVLAARDLKASAVCISVSSATRGRAVHGAISDLRERLGKRTALVVGGAGAPLRAPDGVTICIDLAAVPAVAEEITARATARSARTDG